MLTYTIFLASSAELADDRIAFGDMVQELNQRYRVPGRNVQFSLYKWERDLTSFSEMRKQDVYNQNIEHCHIFIMLYGSKVGNYTEEEYDFAYSRFKNTGAPQVIVFKKSGATPADNSVAAFDDKLKNRDKQFKPYYKDRDELRNIFINEIGKYFDQGILQYGVPATTIYSDGQSVPANFIGRTEELKAIRKKLTEGGNLMLINAEGGIGKTTLAAKYWEDSLYDYKHNAWLFCENGIVNEFKKLAPGLNLDLTHLNEEQQIAVLKNALQNISHNFLLVLDNANNDKHIEAFKQTFRGFHWHVLITSRCKGILDEGQEYEITHLLPPLAKDLFVRNYREDTPEFDPLLDRLLEAIDYHTLLVEIFSKNMKELRMRGETLKDFLAQLENKGLYLEERSFRVPTDYTLNRHKDATNTDAILNILYDFTELAEEERYYLVNMALLPAVPHLYTFLCDIFGQDVFKFNTLKNLARKGWLGMDNTTYRISPVIQMLVLEKHKDGLQEDSKALIDNLNVKLENDGVYLKHFNKAGPYAVLVESITGHLINQPFYELGLLNLNASTYYIRTGDLFSAIAYANKYKVICEKIADKVGLADSYETLGRINQKLGGLPEALKCYEDNKRLMEELHRDYPRDVSFKNRLAASYSNLGSINETLGRLPEALTFYEDDIMLSEELHRDYPEHLSLKRIWPFPMEDWVMYMKQWGN